MVYTFLASREQEVPGILGIGYPELSLYGSRRKSNLQFGRN